MSERYWNDADSQWPEGHAFDAERGRFDGLERDASSGHARESTAPSRRRLARAYQRSDERVREDVCERLAHSNAVDPSEVMVTVRDGVVTFEGSVATRGMRYALEDIAVQCLGVIDVDNRVRVAGR